MLDFGSVPENVRAVLHRRGFAFGVVVLVAAACTTSTPPPAAAAPDIVLRYYLDALVRGDCSTSRSVWTGAAHIGDGDLCGATRVTSYIIGGAAPSPFTDEAEYVTTLITTGTGDGSIQPGSTTWFYDLKRQPGGAWRVVSGGSGP